MKNEKHRIHDMIGIALITIFAFAGCASTGEVAPNLGERLANDAVCFSALTAAGVSIANPAAGAAVGALQIVARINEIGMSNMPSSVLGACAATIGYAAQDAAAIKARAKDHLEKAVTP